MKEHPALFSAPMVRALLDGSKTKTRRIMEIQPTEMPDVYSASLQKFEGMPVLVAMWGEQCCIFPYGQLGDRLWVLETFSDIGGGKVEYRADREFDLIEVPHWTKSICMPRWASRITLEIVSVSVEHLKDISACDAWAEGIPQSPDINQIPDYEEMWSYLNGQDRLYANLWVWVIEFRLVSRTRYPV